MRAAFRRPLTEAECAQVSPGLMEALGRAGVAPWIIRRAHPGARVAALWRGATPILARPGRIFWPGAPEDLAGAGDRALAILQHELQHVLDYATGELSAARYLLNPKNWRYRYELRPGARWRDFGAEQRASIAEHWWLLERGRADLVARDLHGPPPGLDLYRRVIPWAEERLEGERPRN
jgi:hypothetical protein